MAQLKRGGREWISHTDADLLEALSLCISARNQLTLNPALARDMLDDQERAIDRIANRMYELETMLQRANNGAQDTLTDLERRVAALEANQ